MTEGQALPPLGANEAASLPHSYTSAYNRALQAESHAQTDSDRTNARVVGYFLLDLWNRRTIFGDTASSYLTREIDSFPSEGYQQVYDLGQLYIDHLVRSFRTDNRQCSISDYVSHPSMEKAKESIQKLFAAKDDDLDFETSQYARSREIVYGRDGFSCVISGAPDMKCWTTMRDLRKFFPAGILPRYTSPAHIMNNTASRTISGKLDHKPHMLSVLAAFGMEDLVQSHVLHSPENMMVLTMEFHRAFDELKIWFEQTDVEHVYMMNCVPDFEGLLDRDIPERRVDLRRGLPSAVMVMSDEDRMKMLPNTRLLSLHATCARVAHMSGAAEVIDRLYYDAEDVAILASDGSSAALLEGLLRPMAWFSDVGNV